MKTAVLPRLLGALLGASLLVAVPAAAQLSFEINSTAVRGVVHDLTVGDTNGDGRGDVVVATVDAAGRHVIVFVGGPSGKLRPLWSEKLTVVNYYDTTVDLAPVLSRDGAPLDLVLNNVYPSFRMGDGDGTFDQAWGGIVESGEVYDAAVGEFDGDGEIDNVILLEDGFLGNLICFASGNGTGTFTITGIDNATISTDSELEFARLDDNARADAVIGDSNGVRIVLYPITAFSKKTVTSLATSDIAVADVNADGHEDPIYSVPGEGSLGVSLGNGDGTFALPRLWSAGMGPDDIAVADLDGDGILDVAVTDPPSAAVQVLIGRGAGAFLPPQTLPLADAQGQLAATDVNGDGRIDLVLAHTTAQMVTTLINLGDR